MARPPVKFRSLRVTPEFRDFVLDQLAGLRELRAKRMFGGIGLYSGERFFGIVAADELFFKVDDGNRGAYQAEELEPFSYEAAGQKRTIGAYWRVPERLFDEPDEMLEWARAALAAGRRAAGKKKPKPRVKAKRSR